MNAKGLTGEPGDFDFLLGRWHIRNRRLQQRHAGCNDWDEFPATLHAQTMFDGAVSVDEFVCPARDFRGLTLRSLNRETKQWSIWWIDSRDGRLLPPVQGGFDGARGEFHGEDVDDGRSVAVRYLWSRDGDRAARWEQAFALEGGKWETNWVMQFERVADAQPAGPVATQAIADRYVALWNEPDASARRRCIEALWAESGAHFTPSMQAHGYDALERRVTGAWEKWVRDAGHSFRALGDAEGHHGGLRLRWEMVTPNGEVSSVGFDFLLLDDAGRIVCDHQFIDR